MQDDLLSWGRWPRMMNGPPVFYMAILYKGCIWNLGYDFRAKQTHIDSARTVWLDQMSPTVQINSIICIVATCKTKLILSSPSPTPCLRSDATSLHRTLRSSSKAPSRWIKARTYLHLKVLGCGTPAKKKLFYPLCPSGPFSSFLAFFSHRTAFCLFLLASSFPIRVDRISISSCTLSSSGLDLRFIFGLFLQACAWVVTKQGWSEYGSRSPSRERSLHKWWEFPRLPPPEWASFAKRP